MDYKYEITPEESRSFRDVSMTLSRNPLSADINILKDDVAIKNAVKNIILTKPGEKLYEPNFGSNVTQLLFEPLDFIILEEIKVEILRVIYAYEPRVKIEDVILNEVGDYQVDCTISYKIVGQQETKELTFLLEPR